MGVSTFPVASAGGGIKAVQRGLVASAGTVTITAVDTTKAFVNVFGTTSSGYAAIAGNINAANGSTSGYSGARAATTATVWKSNNNGSPQDIGSHSIIGAAQVAAANFNANGQNIGLNATSMSAGTTNLVTAVTQGYLSNSTSLVVSGACRWEVVEFA